MSSLVNYFLLLALVVFSLAGCGESPEAATRQSSTLNPQPSPVLRLHWLGKKRLSAEANATNFISVWNMPESVHLETQTLDKLATAPWRLIKSATPLSNAPVALLRPLLDDLVQEESYLEIISATNQPTEAVFAIKLPADRAALWQTNLPLVLRSLSAQTQDAKPQMPNPHAFNISLETLGLRLDLTRSGDWTLLTVSDQASRTTPGALAKKILSRITATGSPYERAATNYWISGMANLSWMSQALRLQHLSNADLPVCDFSATGDGMNVRTKAGFQFQKALAVNFNSWNTPTNMISDQLVSFTAIRLAEGGVVKNIAAHYLGGCFDQNQVFVWALRSLPMATYVAVPTSPESACFDVLSKVLAGDVNHWISSNAVGSFTPNESGKMMSWQGAPFMTAYVQSFEASSGNLIVGGLVPTPLTNRAPNLELVNRMMQKTNMVYYDWEYSAPRVESWFYIGQLGRVVFGRPQLPATASSVAWLKAIGQKLGNAGTVATMTDSKHISVERFSTLGLTAVELHLVADWLESTNFPAGFHTTSQPAKPLLRRSAPMPVAPN